MKIGNTRARYLSAGCEPVPGIDRTGAGPFPFDLIVGPTASGFSANEAVLDFFDAAAPAIWTAAPENRTVSVTDPVHHTLQFA